MLLLFYFLFLPLYYSSIIVLSTNDSYPHKNAAFGPQIEKMEAILLLVEMMPPMPAISQYNSLHSSKGCQPVIPPTIPNNHSWIALVERGACPFVDKVRNMQASGAAGVIVGDDEKNNGLITMYASGDTSDVMIPSFFIHQWSYRDLRYLTLHGPHRTQLDHQTKDLYRRLYPLLNDSEEEEETTAEFSGEDYLWIRIERTNDFQWPILDIIVVTVVAPAVIMVFLYSLWRFRRRRLLFLQQQQQNQSDLLGCLAPGDLIHLPIKLFQKDLLKPRDSETCAICLEDFEEGDEIRLLILCGHSFHIHCIDQWLLTRKRNCPVCKTEAWNSSNPTSPVSTESIRIPTTSHLSETTPLLSRSEPPPRLSSRENILYLNIDQQQQQPLLEQQQPIRTQPVETRRQISGFRSISGGMRLFGSPSLSALNAQYRQQQQSSSSSSSLNN